jgi:hypothetical protein
MIMTQCERTLSGIKNSAFDHSEFRFFKVGNSFNWTLRSFLGDVVELLAYLPCGARTVGRGNCKCEKFR